MQVFRFRYQLKFNLSKIIIIEFIQSQQMKYEFVSDQPLQIPWWNHHHFILFEMIFALVLIISILGYMLKAKPNSQKQQKRHHHLGASRHKKSRTSKYSTSGIHKSSTKFEFKETEIQTQVQNQDITMNARNSSSFNYESEKKNFDSKFTSRVNRFAPDTLIYRDKKQLLQIQERKQKQMKYRRDLELRARQEEKQKLKQAEDKKNRQIREKQKQEDQKKKLEQKKKKEEALSKNKVQTIQKTESQKQEPKPIINKLTQTVKTQKIEEKNKNDQKPKSLFNNLVSQTSNNSLSQNLPQPSFLGANTNKLGQFLGQIKEQKNDSQKNQQNTHGIQNKLGIIGKQPQKPKNPQQSYKPIDLSKNPAQNPLQKIKMQKLKNQSNLSSNQFGSSSGSLNIDSVKYLESIMEFADKAKQSCEITTRMNNFGGPKSSIKQLWQKSNSFISTINVSKPTQVQTFAFKLWNLIVNTLIRNSSSKEGVQRMPAKPKGSTCEKNALNSYILSINIYRMLGHQKIWLIIFGKTLRLLQFIYKRKKVISQFKELDLLANNHFVKQGQQLAIKYLLRVDFLTYFLFGLTTYDPILFANYISQTSKQDKATVDEFMKCKYKWSYKQFWFLYQVIMKNQQKTYFKPILYMNLLSSIYLQAYENKVNNMKWKQFIHIYKYILKEALVYTKSKQFQKLDEIKNISEWEDIEGRGFCFYSEDFCDEIIKLQSRFKEKDIQFKLQKSGFQDKASIFYYFKGNL